MKKIITALLLVSLLSVFVLSSCDQSGTGSTGTTDPTKTTQDTDETTTQPTEAPAKNDLKGTAKEALKQIQDKLNLEMMNFDDEITEQTSEGFFGLKYEDYTKYCNSAQISNAALTTVAHQIALIECKDEDSAKIVKGLAESNFDPRRWVCVMPDQAFAAQAGNYVLLCASDNDTSAKIKTAFTELSGTSDYNVFFELDKDGADPANATAGTDVTDSSTQGGTDATSTGTNEVSPSTQGSTEPSLASTESSTAASK